MGAAAEPGAESERSPQSVGQSSAQAGRWSAHRPSTVRPWCSGCATPANRRTARRRPLPPRARPRPAAWCDTTVVVPAWRSRGAAGRPRPLGVGAHGAVEARSAPAGSLHSQRRPARQASRHRHRRPRAETRRGGSARSHPIGQARGRRRRPPGSGRSSARGRMPHACLRGRRSCTRSLDPAGRPAGPLFAVAASMT